MFVSLVISTYRNPAWLQKVLWGYLEQTRTPDEILIADDGSSVPTAAVINRIRRVSRRPIIHVWQADRGFRKCLALNRAIKMARGDYLIFSDGDCIPRPDFVETHCQLAKPFHFLSGGMLRLPLAVSQKIERTDIVSGKAFSPAWLINNGLLERGTRFPRQLKLLSLNGATAAIADRMTSTRATFNGHNASAWKQDILLANGFDERMQYGGLDRDLGERLQNSGVCGMQIRHRAICVHLDHGRPWLNDVALQRNREIRRQTQADGSTRTDFGICKPGQPDIESKSYVIQTTATPDNVSQLTAVLGSTGNSSRDTQDTNNAGRLPMTGDRMGDIPMAEEVRSE